MKKVIAVIAALVVAAVSGRALLAYRSERGQAAESPPPPVAVERGGIQLTVSSTGVVESNLDVEIKCKASGEIISLPYDISDPIEEGTLLVELDPVDEERNVRQAEVELASSEAQLAQARRNLETAKLEIANARLEAGAALRSAEVQAKDKRDKADRMKSLLEKEYASPEEYETAEAEAAAAAASLESARVRLQEIAVEEQALEVKRQDVILAECKVESDTIALADAKQRLDYTKVYAPMSGVISDRYVQKGQIISSPTSNVGGGTELLMLSDLSRVFVVASVDESDIGGIEVGQSVDVTVDAFPALRFPGEVVRIATKGENVSSVVTFDVKIEVFGEEKDKLRPEMTANVEILVADRKDVLLVPSESLVRKGDQQFVTVAGGPGMPNTEKPVTTGVDDGLSVEIVDGLKEGDMVVIADSGAASRWNQTEGESKSNGRPAGMMIPGMGPPPGR